MQLRQIRIKNFRCIKDLTVDMGDTNALIGENNSGKTALLDAIKIALSRRWGRQGTGFTEYDFYMDADIQDPKSSDGIVIDLEFRESLPDEWPDDLTQSLDDIIQTDNADIDSITLRAECAFNPIEKRIDSHWSFLDLSGEPLTGRGARAINFNAFFDYVPVFSLAALRDTSQEFGVRSSLWSRLLKTVSIPDETEEQITSQLSEINDELLSSDEKLERIRSRLANIQNVFSPDQTSAIQLTAVPLNTWDLLSRVQVTAQGRKSDPWLPLDRHGQGIQSLSVIMLFQAFVENALGEAYGPHSEPILLLEEPEAHLHPQAARALGTELQRLAGQKIVTTHSPHFVERIPFDSIRVLRRPAGGTTAHSVPRTFTCSLPANDDIRAFVAKRDGVYIYDDSLEELTLQRAMSENERRSLMQCYTGDNSNLHHTTIRDLFERSQMYLSDRDLAELQDSARRIRGEIFFAQKWLLCEGQTEYVLYHAFFEHMGYPLDQAGIAVIDYQNSGSPGGFATIAETLGFPWILTCDGDDAGTNTISALRNRSLPESKIQNQVVQLPYHDLEELLVAQGLGDTLHEIATDRRLCKRDLSSHELVECMRSNKTEFANALASKLARGHELKTPDFFENLRDQLKALPDG